MPPIIEVRNLSKLYRLGQIGRGSLVQSTRYRWRRMRGLPTGDLDNSDAHIDVDPGRRGPVPNSFWAIKDISFSLNQGEVLGIIGRNGAGKSTLLKVLSRITEPTSGHAILRGRVAALLEVGTGFHAELTGRENVYLNGTILGLKKWEVDANMDQIIEFSGVEKFIDTPVKRYSSGMAVRLAFAVAAHLNPDILIVDEVLAVGDHDFRRRCIERMKEAAYNGTTVILVSHQLTTVEGLCPMSMVVKAGELQRIGSTQEIIADYLADAPPSAASDSGAALVGKSGVEARISLEDARGRKVGQVASGQHVRFVVELTHAPDGPAVTLAEVACGLQIITSSGQYIASLNPYCYGMTYRIPPGRHRLTCSLNKLPLMSGDYQLRLSLTAGDEVLLQHERALTFHVVAGDYFGSSIDSSFGRQGVFLDQHWTCAPSSGDGASVS